MKCFILVTEGRGGERKKREEATGNLLRLSYFFLRPVFNYSELVRAHRFTDRVSRSFTYLGFLMSILSTLLQSKSRKQRR